MTFHRSHRKHLHPHHIYQLEVIFLFILGFFLFFSYFLLIQKYNLDMAVYQWYFTIPWTLIFTAYGLKLRGRIPKGERISPLKLPMVHWILLGIAIIAYQIEPVNLERYYSFDLTFIVFTLFLADSYWDFI